MHARTTKSGLFKRYFEVNDTFSDDRSTLIFLSWNTATQYRDACINQQLNLIIVYRVPQLIPEIGR